MAIVAALLTIALALFVSEDPAWLGRATVLLAGLALLLAVVLAAVVLGVVHNLRHVDSNDIWVYW